MLEMFTLKQHLDATRKELSQVLYQHDAACRVVARLIRERDEARAMLGAGQGLQAASTVQAFAAGRGGGAAEEEKGMEVDTSAAAAAAAAGITDAVLAALTAKGKELSQGRKKRFIPPTLASAEAVGSYAEAGSAAPHATKTPGVTCLAVRQNSPEEGGLATVTGGADCNAVVFDHSAKKVVGKLSGHEKKLTAALFHPDPAAAMVVTASADKTVKLWSLAGLGGSAPVAASASIGGFGGECSGVSLHPTGEYAAVSCKDGSWAFSSLKYAATLHTVAPQGSGSSYNCTCFHPDGLLLGLGGGGGNAEIWDMKTQKMIHAFEGGHGGHGVSSLSFSENGYYMASTSQGGGEVKLWDLRKLTNLQTLELPDGKGGLSVKFDLSGTFLGVGCASGHVMVQSVKDWKTVYSAKGHSKEVTAVGFNRDATALVSASMDRTVKLWAPK